MLNLGFSPRHKEINKTMTEIMRIAAINDAEAVTTLTRMAYAKWVPVIGREPLPMKADHAAFIKDHRVDLCSVIQNWPRSLKQFSARKISSLKTLLLIHVFRSAVMEEKWWLMQSNWQFKRV